MVQCIAKVCVKANKVQIRCICSVTHSCVLESVTGTTEKTKDRRKSYETLKNKDEKDQQVIAQQLLYTTSLFEDIQKFQDKTTTYDSMAKKKISEILTEYDFFQKASSIFKNRLLSDER